MKATLFAIIAIVLIAIAAGGYYWANRPTTTSTTTTTTQTTPTPTFQASTAATITPLVTQTLSAPTSTTTATTSITVSGKEYSFTPNKITVSKGSTVKLTFTNDGTMEHNLVIPSLNVSTKTISPGQSDTIQFTANQAGTFDYYCSLSNHKALGMTGTLTVQ